MMFRSARCLISTSIRTSFCARNVNQIGSRPFVNFISKNEPSSKTHKIPKRKIHTSIRYCGLEEFFEPKENIGEKQIKSAAPWSRDLLRLKSSEDLHKLWFVLLKERNMLETMQFHYETVDEPMPSPERLEKVAESMSNLRDVLEEREKTINMLLVGRPTKEGGEYRKSALGATYWYQYKPHLIPKHLAKDAYGDKPADLAYFNHLLQEWHIRFQERKERVWLKRQATLKIKWKKIRKNNPSLSRRPPRWWLDRFKCKLRYGLHPELPVFVPRKELNKRKVPYHRRYHSDYD